ncbi:hypothetical protein [Sphingosinicella rhizophila]|uniref:Uncharacterized protein n=1 Tax=Sphingosinicella rhizophila TaxID=3050082 RepID=A0ABU3Q9I6_9SPHN|nr:hypothetical protein [Sphingosinicella sp. GR2756]MDT9600054.1 hypothetical protein [Sphingosinicella sp. GR2756]
MKAIRDVMRKIRSGSEFMGKAASRKIRKARTPEDQALALARNVGVPEAQRIRGDLRVVPVANRTEAEQRHAVRSGETRTVRKLTRIEKLQRAGTIAPHEAAACAWYAAAHELGYATLGITGSYERIGEGGRGQGARAMCHLPRYKAQEEARADYAYGREAIPPFLLPLFERVVLAGESMSDAGGALWEDLAKAQRSSKLASAFRLAANKLHERVGHMLSVE